MSIRFIIKEVSPGVRTIRTVDDGRSPILKNTLTTNTDPIFTEMLEALRQCRAELLSTYLIFGSRENAFQNSNGLRMATSVLNSIDDHLESEG